MIRETVTGLRRGAFDVLEIRRQGSLREINDVLDSLGGGSGSGLVSSVTAPLNIDSNGQLSIDLNAYVCLYCWGSRAPSVPRTFAAS